MATEIFSKDNVNFHAKQNRQREYAKTTDSLFFKVQRGEIEMQVWLDAVQAIKDRFPYVEEDLVIEIPSPQENA